MNVSINCVGTNSSSLSHRLSHLMSASISGSLFDVYLVFLSAIQVVLAVTTHSLAMSLRGFICELLRILKAMHF